MSSEVPPENTGSENLSRFERNRYFNGKLMTARDMATEQLYHRNRFNTVSRHVLGAGLVSGLQTKISEENGQLKATIDSGVALDEYGRPIVVVAEGPVTVTSARSGRSEPPSGPIYVYLEYDECGTEQVPPSGAESGSGEDCNYNRIVEKFNVRYTPRPREFKTVSGVAFPTEDDIERSDGTAEPDDPGLGKMARSYYDQVAASDADNAVPLLLGQFEREAEADENVWTRAEEEDRRPFVYTNDMLYAMIARHVTNFEDPHGIEALQTIGGVGSEDGDVELSSMDGTITITAHESQGEGRVNFDVSGKVVIEEELDKRTDRLDDRIDEIQTESKEAVDGLTERLNELEEQSSERIDDLKDRIDKLEEQVSDLQQQLEEFEDEAEDEESEDDTEGDEDRVEEPEDGTDRTDEDGASDDADREDRENGGGE